MRQAEGLLAFDASKNPTTYPYHPTKRTRPAGLLAPTHYQKRTLDIPPQALYPNHSINHQQRKSRMITPNFNTLTATQNLRDSGIANPQAEAIVHQIVESQTDLATKDDLTHLEERMATNWKTDLAELKYSITIRLGAMMVATAGLILAGMSALLGL
ncbi:MAG: hypothetical protein ACR2P7_04615 [bacterium]